MVVTRVEMDRMAWLVVGLRLEGVVDVLCEMDNTKVIVTVTSTSKTSVST